MISAAALSRRSLLGLAALGLAGCKHHSSPSAHRANQTGVDPDSAALAAARAAEEALVARYDRLMSLGIGGNEPFVAERAAHAAHLAVLGGPEATPSGTPSSTPSPTASPEPSLRSVLRSSASSLRAAAVAASDGAHAAVFASIAASHEVMIRD